MEDNDFFKRTIKIERTLNAPIDLVWKAWTTPEHIVKWWNPRGSNTQIEKHDFRIGGEWKYIMVMPNGQPFIAEGKYTDIEFHKRIFSIADFKPMTQGVEIQSTFKAEKDTTHFIFNIVHPTEDYKNKQERMGSQNGWGSVFQRLEDFLQTIK